MDSIFWLAAGYWLVMSAAAFILFGMDKSAARKKRRRISERTLFTFSLLGGGAGAWAGMSVWRHKTKHASFRVGIPLITVLNIAILGAIVYYAG
ncbi:DUF1294 domain-containing protein [Paenibacillus pasadenensis]|uniref:DUF1294 domain-containing protein n=1 Tax=Paenibacillus pasadenensis TaxID=217090 RepID=UPI00203C9FBD|nr:DUF1294 domain-containing protein [Paenibacillus pasadenensis]MCM3745897.1 DUF1294 domain-containing protein [Paenibacillus pasadenensis]